LFPVQPPPPTATLFPYTTLFRSRGQRDGHEGARDQTAHPTHGEPRRIDDDSTPGLQVRIEKVCPGSQSAVPHHPPRPGTTCRRPDRKSTRLNSSHVKNSYAVFCL